METKIKRIGIGTAATVIVMAGLSVLTNNTLSPDNNNVNGVPTEVVVDQPTYDATVNQYNDDVMDSHHPSAVGQNQIVRHKAFMLSYNESHEQSDWVMYCLTEEMVRGAADRNEEFMQDPAVRSESASTKDYSGSGFDRGHLCASADIRNDDVAHDETYYMSNISPQTHDFNAGIWNDLEMQTRAWARNKKRIYVVTGPVLNDNLVKIEKHKKKNTQRSNYNGVSIPEKFYKIIYCPNDGGHMIGFMFNNEGYAEGEPLANHTYPVDYLEKITGIDFFPGVPNEQELEEKRQGLKWWKNKE